MTTEYQESCILLVDDEPKNIQVLASQLQVQGYNIEFATNGAEALHWVNTRSFDVILLDIMMPGMDGYEVCRQLKRLPQCRDIPVIFLTAKSETESMVEGFRAGAVDYITKPFQKEELLARVKTHTTLVQQQRTLNCYVARIEDQNRELQHKNAQLEELNASKDKFFSIMAHDLKTPLTSFLTLGELLSDFETMPVERVKESVSLFRNSARRLLTLLENLLSWSRMQRGMLDYIPQVMELKDFVDRNIQLLTPHAAQKNITLHAQIPQDVVVYADLYMLDTIIRNLLSNAVKFTGPGGSVTISAASDPSMVTVAVTDTGIGIPSDKLSALFRVDITFRHRGTAGETGTGLGLILCKEFVDKHGGAISVESEVGVGTTFTVTLPCQPDEGQEAAIST